MKKWEEATNEEKLNKVKESILHLGKEIGILRYEVKIKNLGTQNVNYGQEIDLQISELCKIFGVEFLQ